MRPDTRRLTLITARITKRLTLRQVAAEVSKRAGSISHQTIWNLENGHQATTSEPIKQALCEVLGLDTFPDDAGKPDEAVVP